MKYLLVLLFVLLIMACNKNKDCNKITITNSAPGCNGWGIIVKGIKYPSSNIPAAFQDDGLKVCANYELYEDMRLCVCCGGTWANIKSMEYLPE